MNIQSILILIIIIMLFVFAIRYILNGGVKCSGNCARCSGGKKSCCH